MADNSSNVVLGFVVGAAAGVAAGMLLAPKSGEETRHLIADKAHEATNAAKDKMGQMANKTKAAVREGQRAAKET